MSPGCGRPALFLAPVAGGGQGPGDGHVWGVFQRAHQPEGRHRRRVQGPGERVRHGGRAAVGPGRCPQGCGPAVRLWGACPCDETFLWPPRGLLSSWGCWRRGGAAVICTSTSPPGGLWLGTGEPPCPHRSRTLACSSLSTMLTCPAGPPRAGSPSIGPERWQHGPSENRGQPTKWP